jgi:hypothetical protein
MPQEQGITEISTLLRQSQGGAYFSNAMLVGQPSFKNQPLFF